MLGITYNRTFVTKKKGLKWLAFMRECPQDQLLRMKNSKQAKLFEVITSSDEESASVDESSDDKRSLEDGFLVRLKKGGWQCKIMVGNQLFCRRLKSEQEGKEWLAEMRAYLQEENLPTKCMVSPEPKGG